MRAIRFHELGEPEQVLRLEAADEPHPGEGAVRVRVEACGVNPADWALCRGLFFDGAFPKGVGLEVSGVVDEVGAGVVGTAVGDRVFGPVPFTGPSAGAADLAVLTDWAPLPDGLDPLQAAALPMAAETAQRSLDATGVRPGELLLVHGAGSVIGGMAVELALHAGVRVVATAGPARAAALRARGAAVTDRGEGLVDRVRTVAGGPVDRAFDASPVDGGIPDLIELTGSPDRVVTVGDAARAEPWGVRTNFTSRMRNDVLPEVGRLAAAGEVEVPIAQTYRLEDFEAAVARSRSNSAGGKLVLLVHDADGRPV